MTDTNLTQTQFEEALVDVRKSYRLLYLYQDRVLKTVKYISESLGFGTPTGFNDYCNTIPPNGKPIDLNFWAWDWLAMYWYKFDFGTRPNGIRFHIHIQSDTGFEAEKDKTNIHSFNLVENSQTRLLFVLRKNTKEEIDETRKQLDEKFFFKQNESTCVLETKSENSYCVAKAFPFSRFINQTETDKCIEEFLALCWENGMSEEEINWGQGVASDSKVRDEAQEKRHEEKFAFWQRITEKIKNYLDLSRFWKLKPTVDTYWSWMSNNISYRFNATQSSMKVELYIDTPDSAQNLRIYESLLAQKEDIEKAFEGKLTWDASEGKRKCVIYHVINEIGYKSPLKIQSERIDTVFKAMQRLIFATEKRFDPNKK